MHRLRHTSPWRFDYPLLFLGFLLLVINHISVVAGNPWLIPGFMRLF